MVAASSARRWDLFAAVLAGEAFIDFGELAHLSGVSVVLAEFFLAQKRPAISSQWFIGAPAK